MKIETKDGVFVLVNNEKVDRTLHGTLQSDGSMKGGLGDDASDDDILAHYDKFGGLIRDEEGDTVCMGSFWDFKGGAPHKKPQISREYRINGKVVIVKDGEKVPGIVTAFKQGDTEDEVEEDAPKTRTRNTPKVGAAKKTTAKKAK